MLLAFTIPLTTIEELERQECSTEFPRRNNSPLATDIRTILTGLEFQLLNITIQEIKGSTMAYLTIHSAKGVSLDDCAFVSKVILPRLKLFLHKQDLRLEVASPGLERKLQYFEEFEIFKGRSVRVLLENSDWIFGRIISVLDDDLLLEVENIGIGNNHSNVKYLSEQINPSRGNTLKLKIQRKNIIKAQLKEKAR